MARMTPLLRYLRGAPARPNSAPGAAPRPGDVYAFRPRGAAEDLEGVVLKVDGARVALRDDLRVWARVPLANLGRRSIDGASPLTGVNSVTFARRWLGWPYGHYAAAIALGMPRVPEALRPSGLDLWRLLLDLDDRGVDPLRWDLVREALPELARANRAAGWRDDLPGTTPLSADIARELLLLPPPPVAVSPEDFPSRYARSASVAVEYRAGDVKLVEDLRRRPEGVDTEDVVGQTTRAWMDGRIRPILERLSPHIFRSRAVAGAAPPAAAASWRALEIAVPTPAPPRVEGWLTVSRG